VGNWIADEALYQAAIDPRRPASSLSPAEVARLRARLHAIVHRAVAVGADDRRFPRRWLFHHRWGRAEGARTARGERIVHLTIGGRTTAFAPARQR
jgi:formamidopyrimidine-DNA glycosylase